MEKINFEDGQLVSEGYVEIDGVQHEVHEAEYEGNTPLSAYTLNLMQANIEEEINNQKIETITNDNGTAIKFPDGTMICRKTISKENFKTTSTNTTTVQNIKIYRSNVFDWYFPESFVNDDMQISFSIATGLNGSRFAQGRISAATKSHVELQILGLEGFLETEAGYTNLLRGYAVAIGRWK